MLKRLLKERHSEKDTIKQLIEEELRVCMRVANVYPKNYHAWSHRSQVSMLLDAEQVQLPMLTLSFFTFLLFLFYSLFSTFLFLFLCLNNSPSSLFSLSSVLFSLRPFSVFPLLSFSLLSFSLLTRFSSPPPPQKR